MKTKIQLIEKVIPSKNALVRISEDLDYKYQKLKGIAVLHRIGDSHLLRSCIIDSVEVFPKNFEVAFLQTNAHVAPKDRFFPLDEVADGKKIEIEFQDVFVPPADPITPPDPVTPPDPIPTPPSPPVTNPTPPFLLKGITARIQESYPYTLRIYLLLEE